MVRQSLPEGQTEPLELLETEAKVLLKQVIGDANKTCLTFFQVEPFENTKLSHVLKF